MTGHDDEDEYSFLLEGSVGARLGGRDVRAHADDLLFKPRGQWHTFWNAGDGFARILEIISPGGLEQLVRELDSFEGWPSSEELAAAAARFNTRLDFEGTDQVVADHDLKF